MRKPILGVAIAALIVTGAGVRDVAGAPQINEKKASSRALAPTAASLRLSFSTNALTVSGVTPFAKVFVVSIAREPHKYYSETVRKIEPLTDSDGDGSVTLQLPSGIPNRAIWAVVDLTTGGWAVQPSPGYDNPPMPLSADAFKRSNAKLVKLDVDLGAVEIVLVRPAGGAWFLSAYRNSALDENRNTNQPMRLDVSRMRPAGTDTTAAPESFDPGDFVLVVNPRWMQWAAIEVPK